MCYFPYILERGQALKSLNPRPHLGFSCKECIMENTGKAAICTDFKKTQTNKKKKSLKMERNALFVFVSPVPWNAALS